MMLQDYDSEEQQPARMLMRRKKMMQRKHRRGRNKVAPLTCLENAAAKHDQEPSGEETTEPLCKQIGELQTENPFSLLTNGKAAEVKDKHEFGQDERIQSDKEPGRILKKKTTGGRSAPEHESPDQDVTVLEDYTHTCAVCYEVMYRPHRVQPCRHTFCVACLYSMTKYKTFGNHLCPMCRSVIRHCVFDLDLDKTIRKTYSSLYSQRKQAVEKDKTKGRKLPSTSTVPIRRRPVPRRAPAPNPGRRPLDVVLTLSCCVAILLLVIMALFFWAKYILCAILFLLFMNFAKINSPCKVMMVPVGVVLAYYQWNPPVEDDASSGFVWSPSLSYVLVCYGCLVLSIAKPTNKLSLDCKFSAVLFVFYLLSSTNVCQIAGLFITGTLVFNIATIRERHRRNKIILFSCFAISFLLITAGNLQQEYSPPFAFVNLNPCKLIGLLILTFTPFYMVFQTATRKNYKVFASLGIIAVSCLISEGKSLEYGLHLLSLVYSSIGLSSSQSLGLCILIYLLLIANGIGTVKIRASTVAAVALVVTWLQILVALASRKIKALQLFLTLSIPPLILYCFDLLSGSLVVLSVVGDCIISFCFSRRL